MTRGVPSLPEAARPFVTFATLLRSNGFAVAPDQTENFVAGVGLLGPRSLADVHAAARATLAPPPERFDAFDGLFRAHFLGQSLAAPAQTADEERAFEPEDDGAALIEPEEQNEAGADASGAEIFAGRTFGELNESDALRAFRRAAPTRLPHRTSRRLRPLHTGDRLHMRRALRDAVKRDGEVVVLPRLGPRSVQRRILLLVDVSGSMKAETDRSLRFAHTLARAGDRIEIFTVGTRLTRITRALRHRDRGIALDAASAAVSDWDGGTRLGDALTAFLAIPRYAGFARSAYVVIVSDGLERGEPDALVSAVRRLGRLAWGILWLSPLARSDDYVPETEAMAAVVPMLGRLGDGSSTQAVASEVLSFARWA